MSSQTVKTTRPTDHARYKWELLGIVMLGTMMAALDSSIVNISLPNIMADFGSTLDDIEWVITGYMLAFATLMPLTAWLRDRIGHRALYLWSLVVFTIGSVLCGLAWDIPSLVVARVIQALGGGAITPTGMSMISETFEPKERGTALGYWGVGVIVGPAFGPTLGGFLTKHLGWRSIFMVNLPIGIIGVILGYVILRADKPSASQHRPFDFWGFGFLSLFLITFLLGLSKGEHEGWTSAYIITCWVFAASGFVGFILVESILPHGIMDIRLFRYPIFAACMAATLARSVALFGGVFLLPLFLQQIIGLDEVDSGVLMLPGALVIGLFMPISGKLSDRLGPRLPTIVGLFGVAYFMFLYRTLDANTNTWGIIYPMLVRGVGLGLLITPVTVAAMNSIPTAKSGMASSMLNLVQQVGGSLGIAVLATVLSHRTTFHLGVMGAAVDVRSPTFQAVLHNVTTHAHMLGYNHVASVQVATSMIGRKVAQAASVAAFEDAFLIGAVIVLLGVIPAMILPNKPQEHSGEMTILE